MRRTSLCFNIAISFAAALWLSACTKEAEKSADKKIYFNGITSTDNYGNRLVTDTSDWRFDDNWNSMEEALFNRNLQKGCQPAFGYIASIYPNPSKGQFNVYFSKPAEARVDIVIVDQNLNKLFAMDTVPDNNLVINNPVFKGKDTLRMYYKILDGNCEFRGHGDFLIVD